MHGGTVLSKVSLQSLLYFPHVCSFVFPHVAFLGKDSKSVVLQKDLHSWSNCFLMLRHRLGRVAKNATWGVLRAPHRVRPERTLPGHTCGGAERELSLSVAMTMLLLPGAPSTW